MLAKHKEDSKFISTVTPSSFSWGISRKRICPGQCSRVTCFHCQAVSLDKKGFFSQAEGRADVAAVELATEHCAAQAGHAVRAQACLPGQGW